MLDNHDESSALMSKRLNYIKLIEKRQVLPKDKQAEVFDFLEYLADRFGHATKPGVAEWAEGEFSEMSMKEAVRGLEEELAWYTGANIKDHWS
jgi:hypothetical protein